jgi:hypothetical protein
VNNLGGINNNLANVTYAPDPLTNPLGIVYAPGNLTLGDNVTISGSLFVNGNLTIQGNNVNLQAANLPGIDASGTPVQLPVANVASDVMMYQGSLNAQGLVVVGGRFSTSQTISSAMLLNLQGRLITQELRLRKLSDWNLGNAWWATQLAAFNASGSLFFPQWLGETQQLSPAPRFSFAPASSPVTYHWKDGTNPVYVTDPATGGLRWDVIDWNDNP